jgi:hypothetical protein
MVPRGMMRLRTPAGMKGGSIGAAALPIRLAAAADAVVVAPDGCAARAMQAGAAVHDARMHGSGGDDARPLDRALRISCAGDAERGHDQAGSGNQSGNLHAGILPARGSGATFRYTPKSERCVPNPFMVAPAT